VIIEEDKNTKLKIMKKKYILIITIVLSCISVVFSQGIVERPTQLENDFNVLLSHKRNYEKFDSLSKKSAEWNPKRDSLYKLYTQKAESIRQDPKYLAHINNAIASGKSGYIGPKRILYDYVDSALPFDPDIHFIDRLELYKLIKIYVIEKGTLLPKHTNMYKEDGDKSFKSLYFQK